MPDRTIDTPAPLRLGVPPHDVDGIQWANLGDILSGTALTSHGTVHALRAFLPPASVAVVGIIDDGGLWASLIVAVDGAGTASSLTTADSAAAGRHRDMRALASAVVAQAEERHGRCSLGLFFDKGHARTFLDATDKAAAVRAASAAGGLVLTPVPPALAVALA